MWYGEAIVNFDKQCLTCLVGYRKVSIKCDILKSKFLIFDKTWITLLTQPHSTNSRLGLGKHHHEHHVRMHEDNYTVKDCHRFLRILQCTCSYKALSGINPIHTAISISCLPCRFKF